MDISIFETSFWTTHPEMRFAAKLEEFYKQDTSKDKKESSRIMWAIQMCEQPDSKFYNRPNKYEEMSKTFLKNIKVNWKKISNVIDSYRDTALSDAERALTSWNITIKMRDHAIKELYQELLQGGTAMLDTKALKDVDSMLAATPKMFDDYNKIKATFEEEKVHRKGTRTLSLSDEDAL
tara:strand:+ start:102 stop:638 length:537 start_codon:yes stop_codon:yes gene_type:complete